MEQLSQKVLAEAGVLCSFVVRPKPTRGTFGKWTSWVYFSRQQCLHHWINTVFFLYHSWSPGTMSLHILRHCELCILRILFTVVICLLLREGGVWCSFSVRLCLTIALLCWRGQVSPLSSFSGEDHVTCNGLSGQGELGRTQIQNNMTPVCFIKEFWIAWGLFTKHVSCVRLSKG